MTRHIRPPDLYAGVTELHVSNRLRAIHYPRADKVLLIFNDITDINTAIYTVDELYEATQLALAKRQSDTQGEG